MTRFTAEDLDYNRRGQFSPRQHLHSNKIRWIPLAVILIIDLLAVIGLIWVFTAGDNVPSWAMFVPIGVMVLTSPLTLVSVLHAQKSAPRLMYAVGAPDLGVTFAENAQIYTLTVDRVPFAISREEYTALRDLRQITVYYRMSENVPTLLSWDAVNA